MILSSFTLSDIGGCLRCIVAFAAVLLAPGYCVAWALNLLGFRERTGGERLAWGIALSFGLMPLAAVELAKYRSLSAVCGACVTCAAAFLAILAVELRRSPPVFKRVGAGIVAAWVLFAIVELVDVGIGSRLYLSVSVFDNALRTAFVDTVLRTGVPPANPFYWAGHPTPMRYYYFWYVLGATAARLGRATARQAMIASVAWAGFGLASIVALYCSNFLDTANSGATLFRRHWSRLALALGFLLVTGLDILTVVAKAVVRAPTDADMDWWSPDQVGSWIDGLLWVPHHMAGLVCCLFGFLLVWMSRGRSGVQRAACALIAGVSFASAFGLSTWIAIAFAAVMLMWLLWVLWREQTSRERVLVLVAAALVAVLALVPYLSELRHAGGIAAAVAAPEKSVVDNACGLLRFGVRHMIDPDSFLVFPWFAHLARVHPRVEDAITGLILLLPGYALELGIYGLVLVVALGAARRLKLGEAERTAILLVVAGLLVASFFRSESTENNDFGIRSILIAQFFLLLLAVRLCEGGFGLPGRPMRRAMHAMLWLGLAGTVYQAIGLRLYLPVEEALGRPNASRLAERAMAWRRGFDAMDRRIPPSAVVQFNIVQPSGYFEYAQLMQAERQMASSQPGCGTAFGGDPIVCKGIEARIGRLFSPAVLAPTAAEARDLCSQLGVDYLVATRWDGVWLNPQGWVWQLPEIADTGEVRAVQCSSFDK